MILTFISGAIASSIPRSRVHRLSASFFPSMSQQNVHQPTVATLPSGMHARAATIVRNPGNGHMSPAFGPARVPLVQTTLEQARAHSVAASPPIMPPIVPSIVPPVVPPTPPSRFEAGTKDDPVLLSPVKPKMRSLYLTHMVGY